MATEWGNSKMQEVTVNQSAYIDLPTRVRGDFRARPTNTPLGGQ